MEWRDVEGWPYLVSDDGKVWSRSSKRLLTPYRDAAGYLQITLMSNKVARKERIHVLVLEAFVGPRPAGAVCCHANDVKTDNRVTNLYWGTTKTNGRDCVNNGNNVNRNKTHCPRGHHYDAKNTYIMPKGGRQCRTCHNEKNRRARAARKKAMRDSGLHRDRDSPRKALSRA